MTLREFDLDAALKRNPQLILVDEFAHTNAESSRHTKRYQDVYKRQLLVCLAPTTIGALLSAIGIAGMSRLNQGNVLAMSGRAIEAAGDVDILMLDKTGTITLGNRQASEFIPVDLKKNAYN